MPDAGTTKDENPPRPSLPRRGGGIQVGIFTPAHPLPLREGEGGGVSSYKQRME